jgi:hypothetical protein
MKITDDKLLLSGYDFDRQGPSLILDTIFDDKPQRQKFYIRNKSFTLNLVDDTFCIGGYNPKNERFEICPHKAKPEPNKTLCTFCRRMSGFNPAFYNAKTISPQQIIYNEKPHVVYLANFGPNHTKVGIARNVPRRWLEQGARAATIIKHCNNAYEARTIEESTRKNIGVPEAINPITKRKLLLNNFDSNQAEKEIEKIRDSIESKLAFKLERNEIFNFDEQYLNDNTLISSIVDVTKTSTFISGAAIGLIGDILIMQQDSNQYITSLKKFISHLVTFDEKIIPNQNKNQLPLGL